MIDYAAEAMKACRVLQADLEAAQDEIERLKGACQTLGRIHDGGPLRDALLSEATCPPCSTGDHSGHRAELAGVCVGCSCEGAS